jgi:hypothetical protein
MSVVRGGARAWLLTCVWAAACDDGQEPRTRPLDVLDASMQDGDASLEAPTDAVVDAPAPVDAGDAGSPTQACTISTDGVATVSDSYLSAIDPIDVALRNDGATLSWVSLEGGKRRVQTNWFNLQSDDAVMAPRVAEDSTQVEPALAATSAGFVSVWSDDLTGTFTLRARRFEATGEVSAAPARALTSDGGDDHLPVIASGANGNTVVVWQASSPVARVRAMVLGSDGAPAGVAHDLPGYGAGLGRAALARLGSGYVLAWVDAAQRHVHAQRLDAEGKPVGASQQVDAEGNARGNLTLATTDRGGALAFDVMVSGVRPEVRFRAFDANATPIGIEQNVTAFPATGMRPALIAARGGFVLAYRSTEAAAQQLRVALLDGDGQTLAGAKVAALASLDLPLAMGIAPAGDRLFLGWLDQLTDNNGYQLQRAWIHCD